MKTFIAVYFSLLIAYSIFHAGRYYEHEINPPLVVVQTRVVPCYVFPDDEEEPEPEPERSVPMLRFNLKAMGFDSDDTIDSVTVFCRLIVNPKDLPTDTASLACYDSITSPAARW